VRFFKVKKLTDRTKLAAQAQYRQLTSQVAEITESLEQDFKNNNVKIKVAAPTLIIPFQQKNWESIYESEAWVFTMGDVNFNSYTGPDFEVTTHEAFLLKVERVKFEHTSRYCQWKKGVSDISHQNSLPSFEAKSPLPLDSMQEQQDRRNTSPLLQH